MAANISFQILGLGNSSEQLHHRIAQVLDLQNLNLCLNRIAAAIAIKNIAGLTKSTVLMKLALLKCWSRIGLFLSYLRVTHWTKVKPRRFMTQ